MTPKEFKTVFYPFYKAEHSSYLNRLYHFIGTTGFIVSIFLSLYYGVLSISIVGALWAYTWAHFGHVKMQNNSSLRAIHPFACVIGASLMYWEHVQHIVTHLKFPQDFS